MQFKIKHISGVKCGFRLRRFPSARPGWRNQRSDTQLLSDRMLVCGQAWTTPQFFSHTKCNHMIFTSTSHYISLMSFEMIWTLDRGMSCLSDSSAGRFVSHPPLKPIYTTAPPHGLLSHHSCKEMCVCVFVYVSPVPADTRNIHTVSSKTLKLLSPPDPQPTEVNSVVQQWPRCSWEFMFSKDLMLCQEQKQLQLKRWSFFSVSCCFFFWIVQYDPEPVNGLVHRLQSRLFCGVMICLRVCACVSRWPQLQLVLWSSWRSQDGRGWPSRFRRRRSSMLLSR